MWVKMLLFLGLMTNSKHGNNKIKDVLGLGRGLVQKIDDARVYAEKIIHVILPLLIKHFA